VHFVLIGAALVVLGRAAGGRRPGTPPQDELRVSDAQVESLRASFRSAWGRDPTPTEDGAIIDLFVREEALVREALATGMAREDTVVRARLAQRMRFLGAAAADESIPTEDELEAFRVGHPGLFSSPGRATFDHVFLDGKVWGPRVDARGAELLETLRGLGPDADPEQYSDPFRRPYHYDLYAQDVVERTYGSAFGELVRGAPLGEWVGPVDSVYGVHLVRVTDRAPGELLPMDTVRESVAIAWREQRRAEATAAFEDELLGKYRVVIEQPAQESAQQSDQQSTPPGGMP
jgi:hypothetical protein